MDSEHNIPKRNAEESLRVVLKTEVVSWRNTSLFGEKTKQNKTYIHKNIFKGDVLKKMYKKKKSSACYKNIWPIITSFHLYNP